MTKFKKVFAGLAISAALAVAAVVPMAPAKAQVGVFNPISQWIVLSGLFTPGLTAAGAAAASPFFNPISQWIVLSGLFTPGLGTFN